MKHISAILLLLFMLLNSICCSEHIQECDEPSEDEFEANIVQGVVMVKLSEESALRVERGEPLNLDMDIVSMQRVFPIDDAFEKKAREAGLHRWYKIRYSSNIPATKAAGDLSAIEGIEIAETQNKLKNTAYFNDPYLPMMWHLSDGRTPTASINVEPVWQQYTTGSPEVIVGIIDGGIQTDHPDLQGVVIPGGVDGSKNFVNGGFVITAHSHGTHVGGTIAAISNNGIGVSGIAGGDAHAGQAGVRLLSCQVIQTDNGKDLWGDTATAIFWAANHGASIINNSWGYDYDKDGDGKLTGDELTRALSATINTYDKDAIDWFIDHAGFDGDGNQVGPMAGGVVIFAAGNEDIANGAPANYSRVIAVGATDQYLNKASFSNYGDWVDIAAPGVDIYSTYPNSQYALSQGTSMACPHVTGVAALLLSYYGGKGFTNEQLVDKLLNGANPNVLPAGSRIGPLLDAFGSFTYTSSGAPAAVSGINAAAYGNRIRFTFPITGDDDGVPAYSYLMVAGEDKTLIENFDPFSSIPEGLKTATTLVGSGKVGEEINTYISNLDFEKQYYCGVMAVSYHKRYSSMSEIVSISTTENHAPVFTALEDGPFVVKASAERIIPVSVQDPDGHIITISFAGGSDAADYNYDSSTGIFNVIIRGRRAAAGSYTATIKATDSYGLEDSFNLNYSILENEAPIISGSIDDIIVYDKSKTISIDIGGLFTDPENEAMTYRVRGNNVSLAKIEISGSLLKFTPKAYGLSKLTIVAVDAANKECTLPFNILVKNPADVAESFPNPVVDKLTIRTEEEAKTHILMLNSVGVIIFDKTLIVSGFNPAVLDMSGCAPGVYSLEVSYSGKSFRKTVIKK